MFKPTKSKSFIHIQGNITSTVIKPQMNKLELFIGNLRHDKSTRTIINNLQEIFMKVKVSVPDFRFTVFERKSKKFLEKCAYVTVLKEEDKQTILSFNKKRPDGVNIVLSGMDLVVELKDPCVTQRSNTNLFDDKERLKHSASTPEMKKRIFLHETQNAQALAAQKELYIGQHLQSEDRMTEYKRGSGGYLKNNLISHIRKYICAFLNSEGGQLLIGVDDNCIVYGITCTRKQEDQARLQIDNVIKQFSPHVLPILYNIDFIPVKLSASDKIDMKAADTLLKVLKISVNRPNFINNLYINDRDEVYIRRDGSVEGPLKTSNIIQWCKTNFIYHNMLCKPKKDFACPELIDKICESVKESNRRIEEQIFLLKQIFINRDGKMSKELNNMNVAIAQAFIEIAKTRKSKRRNLCKIM